MGENQPTNLNWLAVFPGCLPTIQIRSKSPTPQLQTAKGEAVPGHKMMSKLLAALEKNVCFFYAVPNIFFRCRFFWGGRFDSVIVHLPLLIMHCGVEFDVQLQVRCQVLWAGFILNNIKKLLFKIPSWRSFYSGTKRQQVWTCVKSQVKQSRWSQAFHASCTPLKKNMTLENLQFWIGNTSSHGWFSIVMLVFGWVNVLRFKVKHLRNQIWKTRSKLLHQKSCTSIVHLSYLISILSYPYISMTTWYTPVNFASWQLFAKKNAETLKEKVGFCGMSCLGIKPCWNKPHSVGPGDTWSKSSAVTSLVVRRILLEKMMNTAQSSVRIDLKKHPYLATKGFIISKCSLLTLEKITCSHPVSLWNTILESPTHGSAPPQFSSFFSTSAGLTIGMSLASAGNSEISKLGFQRNFFERFSLCCT